MAAHVPKIISRAVCCETLERRTLLSLMPAGTESLVNTYRFEHQESAAVAMDADGDFVVIWQSFGQDESGTYLPPTMGVYGQRYNAAGVAQGNEFRANTTTLNAQQQPAIAMDDAGNFVVVWSGNGPGDGYGIHAQRYNAAGEKRGGEFRVNTTLPLSQQAPSVAMDPDGDFVVTWTSGAYGFGYRIFAQRFNASGVPQGGELQANTSTTSRKERPDVAMDDAGNFVIAWESQGEDGSGYGVYARRYSAAGAPLGIPFRVNTFTTGDQWLPKAAMDADGDFVITWTSTNQDGGGFGIYAQRYNATGVAQGTEFRVNHATLGNQHRADVAMDSDGRFTIVWHRPGEPGASHYEVYARTYSAAGVPKQDEFLLNAILPSNQHMPAVAMSNDGRAIAAWQGPDGSLDGIYVQRLIPGVPHGPLGEEFLVNSSTEHQKDFPSVAIRGDGAFVVTWQSNGQDGDGYGIYARRFNAAGVPIAEEFRVNSTTAGNQRRPAVAMDADGDFVITWQGPGNETDIFAQRYNAGGTPIGSEFRVNNSTFNDQVRPAIAMDPDGNFVIAWDGFGPGDGNGVFAQRFDPAGVPIGDQLLVNTNTALGLLQLAPAVAVASDQSFVVTWTGNVLTGSFTDDDVFARRFNAQGVPLTGEITVSTTTPNHQQATAIAMAADGTFVISWQNLADHSIRARRFNAAAVPQGDDFRVSPTTTFGSQVSPAIAMVANGQFMIAWDGQVDPRRSIWAQRYSADGVPGGSEFRVNSSAITGEADSGAAIAMNAGGETVVAWSRGSSKNFPGVFARRYGALAAPAVTASSFQFATAPHRLQFQFTGDVAPTVGADDILIENLTTQQTIPSSHLALTFDHETNSAIFSYIGNAAGISGVLPDGNYRATLVASGITNPGGTPLQQDQVLDFFFLNGDANHDGIVNLADFNILAANFGQSPRNFSQGDFNYDGIVNLADFNILASRFGTVLAGASAGSGPTSSNQFGDAGAKDDSLSELLS